MEKIKNIQTEILTFMNEENGHIELWKEEHMKNPVIEKNYKPSEGEPYMNQIQLEYFRQKLITWKEELEIGAAQTLEQLQSESLNQPDITDRASLEIDQSLDLHARNREQKLIHKIDEALLRIEDGSYGYCDETGDPIGVKRLLARPIANLCIEAQEQRERRQRTHRF